MIGFGKGREEAVRFVEPSVLVCHKYRDVDQL